MKRSGIVLVIASTVLFTFSALAQTDVGEQHHGGLHWAIAAPQGASWALNCAFSPVTLHMSQYDRKHWANRLSRVGSGAAQGRLPGDNGSCTLTKTGGRGSVGVAIVKNGQARAAGTNNPMRPAQVNVF
jgi:hypothetical protein